MRKIALTTTSVGGFGVDATYWFEQISNKINLLKNVDDYIAKDLLLKVAKSKSDINSWMIFIISMSVLCLLIVLIMGAVISKKIVKSLEDFKIGLGFFFQYAIREKDYLKPMVINGKDEFAQMTRDMNAQIKKTEFIIEQDKKVVVEIDDIMSKVSSGFFLVTLLNKKVQQEKLNNLELI